MRRPSSNPRRVGQAPSAPARLTEGGRSVPLGGMCAKGGAVHAPVLPFVRRRSALPGGARKAGVHP